MRARLDAMPAGQRDGTQRMLRAGDYLAEHMQDAPALLVFCFNPANMAITDADLGRPSVVGGGSVYPPVQNAMLACRAEGLGCVLTTLLCYREPEIKALLNIPDDPRRLGYLRAHSHRVPRAEGAWPHTSKAGKQTDLSRRVGRGLRSHDLRPAAAPRDRPLPRRPSLPSLRRPARPTAAHVLVFTALREPERRCGIAVWCSPVLRSRASRCGW